MFLHQKPFYFLYLIATGMKQADHGLSQKLLREYQI
jgi:hypothetical protein